MEQNKETKLAYEIADILNDRKSIDWHIACAQKFSESFLREKLNYVLSSLEYATGPGIITVSYSSMRNTLGISLKVKHVGLAVLAEGELVEFRVRTFYGAWTEEKQNDILRTIKKTVSRYQIGAIQVKAPKLSHCSDGILAILKGIERLAQELNIRIAFCTMADLMAHYGNDERCNKRHLIHVICRKYPQNKQLAYLCEKERSSKNAYHVKVFEAIACAELATKTER